MQGKSRVGILLLFFLVGATAFLLWLKGNPFREKRIVSVWFDNVHGLAVGSNVEYAGYPCGVVESFSFDRGGIVTRIALQNEKITLRKKDRFLILPTSTIMTEYHIFIAPGDENASLIDEDTVIMGQAAPGMQDFIFEAEERLKDLKYIMQDTSDILKKVEASIDKIQPPLDDIRAVSERGTIQQVAQDLQQTSQAVSRASSRVEAVIAANEAKINATLASAEQAAKEINRKVALIEDRDITETLSDIRATSGRVRQLSEKIKDEDIQNIQHIAEEGSAIVAQLRSPDPNKDVPTLLMRNLQRIDRISSGLEYNLSRKSLLKVLFSKTPMNRSAQPAANPARKNADNSAAISTPGSAPNNPQILPASMPATSESQ